MTISYRPNLRNATSEKHDVGLIVDGCVLSKHTKFDAKMFTSSRFVGTLVYNQSIFDRQLVCFDR